MTTAFKSQPRLDFGAPHLPRTAYATNACRSLAFHGFSPPKRSRSRDLRRSALEMNCGRYDLLRYNIRCAGSDFGRLIRHECGKSAVERILSLPVRWQMPWRDGRGRHEKLMIAVNAKQKTSISRGGADQQRNPKLDATDMMELEFGRLLGEDRQTTLTKVIGKKINPDVSYVKMEKQKELQQAKLSSRSKQNPRQVMDTAAIGRGDTELISPVLRPGRIAERFERVYAGEEAVPELATPPVRPKGAAEQNSLPVRVMRVVPPVMLGGHEKSIAEDLTDYEGLGQKPVRGRVIQTGLPPVSTFQEVVPPMLMRTKADFATEDKYLSSIYGIVRRPAVLNPNSSSNDSEMAPSEGLQLEKDANSFEMSGKNFEHVLEEKQHIQLGANAPASRTSPAMSSIKPPVAKPVRPSLKMRPAVLEKPSSPVAQGPNSEVATEETEFGLKEAEEMPGPAVALSVSSEIKSAPSTSEPLVAKPVRPSLKIRPAILENPSPPDAQGPDLQKVPKVIRFSLKLKRN